MNDQEGIAAAIKEAEKMLRATPTVHEFNALFKRSKGFPTLLQKSQCIDQYNLISWRANEYDKAKEAIEPYGSGLGRGFIQHFLPGNVSVSPNTLQATITAYYREEWWKDGRKLLAQSQRELWKEKKANDAAQMAAALEVAGALGELGELGELNAWCE